MQLSLKIAVLAGNLLTNVGIHCICEDEQLYCNSLTMYIRSTGIGLEGHVMLGTLVLSICQCCNRGKVLLEC